MKEIVNKSLSQIHNVRFYNLSPRSINCLAYNLNNCKLALSRNDSTIEIWNTRHAPFLEKLIFCDQKTSIEAVAWFENRLFIAGISGELIEWNLQTLEPKKTLLVNGSSAWCMDTHEQSKLLAVGTEGGFINLFSLADNDISYEKILDKQEGRILCCKFDHTGDYLVTGSSDTVRIWDIKTGHAIQKMSTGRSEAKRATIVWSVAVLKDFTIISGDSRGRVTIWDGKMGSQIDSFVALKADVLSVVVNADETTFCCSGIDPIIKIYMRTATKKDNQMLTQWVKFLQRSLHDHDVKALAFAGQKVFSGGVDGYLGVSSTSKQKQALCKYGPFLQNPCASISKEERLILLKYYNYIEVWGLGTAGAGLSLDCDEIVPNSGSMLPLSKSPVKLVELKSQLDEPILCSGISNDGKWIVYSTSSAVRVLELTRNTSGPVKLQRVKDLPEEMTPCVRFVFGSDSATMFMAKSNRTIEVFNITVNGDFNHDSTIDLSKSIKDSIQHLLVSKCGQYLICSGTCANVAVYTYKSKKKSWSHYLNLPKYILPPTALAIHPNRPRIVAAFADSKIYEYDLDDMKFVASTQKGFVPNADSHPVMGIILDERNDNVVILHNDEHLFVLEKTV